MFYKKEKIYELYKENPLTIIFSIGILKKEREIFYSNSLINLEKICIIDIEKESYLKNGRKNAYEKKTSSFNNFGWMGNEPS